MSWTIVEADPTTRRIEASEQSFWMGFTDDIVVRVLVATLLRNFASYSAALAGYTVAIIASDQLGATGGPTGPAFMLAVTRASEICIGIVCAGIRSRRDRFLAAPDAGWPHYSLRSRPKSRADLLPLCGSRGPNSRRHSRFSASSLRTQGF